MFIIRLILDLPLVVLGALAGNYAGDRLYYLLNGRQAHQFQWAHTNQQGEIVLALNPLMSNFIPGLIMGILKRPRWFWAFVGGAVASGFLGDRYEKEFNEFITEQREKL